MSLLYGMDLAIFPDEIIIKCADYLVKKDVSIIALRSCLEAVFSDNNIHNTQILDNYTQSMKSSDYINFMYTCKRMHALLNFSKLLSALPNVNLSDYVLKYVFSSGPSICAAHAKTSFVLEALKGNCVKSLSLYQYSSLYYGEGYHVFLYCIDNNLYWVIDIFTQYMNNEKVKRGQPAIEILEYIVKNLNYIGNFLKDDLQYLIQYTKAEDIKLTFGKNVFNAYAPFILHISNFRQLLEFFKKYTDFLKERLDRIHQTSDYF
jgi:hypothetical protein